MDSGLALIKRRHKISNQYFSLPNSKNVVSGAVSEILWLTDNGYMLQPDSKNDKFMIFNPPSNPREKNILVDYLNEEPNSVLKYFMKIRNQFIKNIDIPIKPERRDVNQDNKNIFFNNRNDKSNSIISIKRKRSLNDNNDNLIYDEQARQNRIKRFGNII